ncbi:unnamed protein product, partial [Phaeothamnion confervicola]
MPSNGGGSGAGRGKKQQGAATNRETAAGGHAAADSPWEPLSQPCGMLPNYAGVMAPTEMPASRALSIALYRCMTFSGATSWDAATAYLTLLVVPGASAYGLFQSTLVNRVFGLLHSWCDGISSGGGGGNSGSTGAAAATSAK